MKIIACVDDKLGMMFNHRRQSQDRIVRQDMIRAAEGSRLWMNGYSYGQFTDIIEEAAAILVDETFLEKAGENDYCFIENTSPGAYEKQISEIILYRWNRRYPGDVFFDIILQENEWRIIGSENFSGYSHDKITKEIYIR